MTLTTYLLDTEVMSELMAAPSRKRRQKIELWLRSLGEQSVLISTVSVAEITRGIKLLRKRNGHASEALDQALGSVLRKYGDTIITPSHEEWQVVAELASTPKLRHLFYGKNENNQPRTGADAYIAAQANGKMAAIATFNTRDFILIDQYLPIAGGIFDPASGVWAREPNSA